MVRQHLLDFLFQKAAKAALGELSIQYWPSQIDKVIQLNSTLQVRHGVMLVGPAGGGKTTTRQILKRALVVLPSIQAREQLEMKGTGDYPEETGSSKTAQSHAVWEFARFIFVMGQFYRLYPAVTVKRNFFPYNVDILLSEEWMRCRSRWAVWFDDSFHFFLYLVMPENPCFLNQFMLLFCLFVHLSAPPKRGVAQSMYPHWTPSAWQ